MAGRLPLRESNMSQGNVRFGLIGFGAWGRCHAEAIANTEGAELTAIAVRSEASRQAAAAAYPAATIHSDYHAMLAGGEMDVVHVVLPSHLHYEVARAVLEHDKHLLLEKPMTLSVADCASLNQLASQHQRLLAVGHELRYSSLWGKVKSLVDEGFVGTPQYVLVELSRRPYRNGSEGWRYDIGRVGSWILEEPIHFFDLARWYLSRAGEPESVYATANARRGDHPELQDNFSAIVRFPGTAYAVVTQTLSAFEHHQTVKLTGTDGAIWASWSGAMDRTRHPTFYLKKFDGETVEEIPIERTAGELFELEDQVAMLVRAVRGDARLRVTGEDGKWSVAMCLAAQRSVETEIAVGIGEFVGV
ncbi:MAG: Gfo/Idh/MocA family protein [Pirellulales bacterium]